MSELSFHVRPGLADVGSDATRLPEISVPGDKSISHRAVMLGSIAKGSTTITGCLMGTDVIATINAMRSLGVDIAVDGNRVSIVGNAGVFSSSTSGSRTTLDLGNSGTSIRLISGLLAGRDLSLQLVGDQSLMKRPMARVVEPLRAMGAAIACADDDRPPIMIDPCTELKAIDYVLPVASAQVKSAILLAGLSARGSLTISQPALSRDHTERMLEAFGVSVSVADLSVHMNGGQPLYGTDIDVPADISSAAFFLVMTLINPGAACCLKNVGVNPTRDGVIHILKLMGADIEINKVREVGGEPVADLVVRAGPLHGVDIPANLVSNAIDEFPAIFIAAAFAEGRTNLRGAAELRVKESDRIKAMADGLTRLGAVTEVFDDGIAIEGGTLKGGRVDSFGDHRIAMSFAIAASRADEPVTIEDCEPVDTSFPSFQALAQTLGLKIESRRT